MASPYHYFFSVNLLLNNSAQKYKYFLYTKVFHCPGLVYFARIQTLKTKIKILAYPWVILIGLPRPGAHVVVSAKAIYYVGLHDVVIQNVNSMQLSISFSFVGFLSTIKLEIL